MSQPSNLKVKRLDELPLLPAGQVEEAFTYAVVNSTDYKLNAGVLAEAAAAGIIDEIADELAPVAFSNSYNDLDDKPFIPQDSDDLPQGTTNLYATAAEKSKLAGIEAGAQVNTVTSVAGKTGAVTLTASDTGAEPAFSKGSIIAGTGVHITGTFSNRLVGAGDITITATGEGGGVVVEVMPGEGIDVDSTDAANPVVSLTSSVQNSLALANTAVQPADLPTGSTSIVLSGGQWQRAAITGDVTLPANSNTATIANKAVTNAKMADMAASTIKGRLSSAGAPQDLTPSQVRTMLSIVDGADWNTNLTNIPANISSWAGIAPSSKANSSVSISAGNGLTGGGNLTANRTISLGTPGTLSGSTTNSVSSSSHTHALSANLKAWDGVDVQNPLLGSTTDSTSSSKTLTLASNGYAGIIASGDNSNSSGEPGGAFFAATVDGGPYTAASTVFLSSINTAGEDGTGGSWTGTTNNSGLLAYRGSGRLQFGTNGQVAMYVQGANAVFNGNVTVSSNISTSGTVSDSAGDLRRTGHRTATGNGNFADNTLNCINEKNNNTAYTWTIPAGLGTPGDIITVLNTGSSGNVTVAAGSGVTMYRSGSSVSSVVVGPGHCINFLRTSVSNRWQVMG